MIAKFLEQSPKTHKKMNVQQTTHMLLAKWLGVRNITVMATYVFRRL